MLCKEARQSARQLPAWHYAVRTNTAYPQRRTHFPWAPATCSSASEPWRCRALTPHTKGRSLPTRHATAPTCLRSSCIHLPSPPPPPSPSHLQVCRNAVAIGFIRVEHIHTLEAEVRDLRVRGEEGRGEVVRRKQEETRPVINRSTEAKAHAVWQCTCEK